MYGNINNLIYCKNSWEKYINLVDTNIVIYWLFEGKQFSLVDYR